MHDPRLGRFFAVDPLAGAFAWNSPYAFSENRLIDAIELEGLEKVKVSTFSFAPFDLFGGNFRGDGKNRKFGDYPIETKDKQNYRLGVDIHLDLATSEYIESETKLYTTNSVWIPGKRWFWEDGEDIDGMVNGETTTQFQEGPVFKDKSLFYQIQGTDAALLWGYNPGNIGVKVDIEFSKITSSEGSSLLKYKVTGEIYGDRFPASETYLSDKNGNRLFIGVSGVDNANKAIAPQMELLGTAFEGMSKFTFYILFH